jgi:antitoxin component YwqK of YwqJK toxin-antitoxin module
MRKLGGRLRAVRKIITPIVLCLLWTIPSSSQTKTDREQAGLVGPVKSVEKKLVGFGLKNGITVEESSRAIQKITYNTQGNILEEISYDQNSAISQKLTYLYDAEGRCTGYDEYAALVDKSLTIPRRHVYKLDDKGRRVEYVVFDSDGTMASRFVYKYDGKGNLTDEEWYAHTGRLGGKNVSAFDEKGNRVSQSYFLGDGTLSWRNLSQYDSDGNRTELLQFQGETVRYKIVSRYDDKRRVLEIETIEFNSVPGLYTSHAPEPGKVVYTYDDSKRTKEVATYDAGGELKSKIIYNYDERENEIGLTSFNHRQTEPKTSVDSTSISIEYDSHGNWTRKVRSRPSETSGPPQPYIAELKVITYY